MSFEVQCPQCVFVSRQIGQPTACLLHVSLPYELMATEDEALELASLTPPKIEDYDEPFAFGQLRPTVDRPGPFTVREYVRLQLLRSRLQADPSDLDQSAPRPPAHSLSGR